MQTAIHSVPRRRTIACSAHLSSLHVFMRVPLFNLFEAGHGFRAPHYTPDCGRCAPLVWGYWELSPAGALSCQSKNRGVSCFFGFPCCDASLRNEGCFFPVPTCRSLLRSKSAMGRNLGRSPCITARVFTGFCRNKMLF